MTTGSDGVEGVEALLNGIGPAFSRLRRHAPAGCRTFRAT